MINRTFIIYILLITTFFSCRKIVEIDIPQTKPSLVVNSFFCPDSLVKVQVLSSSYIFNTDTLYINDATVELYSVNILIEKLQNCGKGFYKSSFKPVPSKKYQIKVKHSDFEDVFSVSSIPQKVVLTSKSNKFNSFRDKKGRYSHQLEIKFTDPVESENFYEIRLYVDSLKNFLLHNALDTIFSSFVSINTNDAVLTSEIDFTKNTPYLIFFSDKLINGTEKTFTLNYTYGFSNNYEPLDTLFNLFIQFNSVSEEHYNYVKKYYNYWYSFSQIYIPEYNYQIYNNIENGFGIFAGYNQYIDSLKFR